MSRTRAWPALLLVVALPGGWSAPNPVAAAGRGDISSLGLTAAYTVNAAFDWNDRAVSVDTVADVTDNVPWSASVLAFNLATLRTGHASVGAITVDGQPAPATAVDDQTILVTLPRLLATGDHTTVAISYTARLNASVSAAGDDWEFARDSDVISGYRWIPWLSRTTPFDRPNVGDPWVTANSPQVNVTITTDTPLTFATTGQRVSGTGLAQTFSATNVRDFNFSASPDYRTASTVVGSTRITFYYLSLPPNQVLRTAARALRAYGDRLGAYSEPLLTIAEVGPWSGIESPGHFWIPSNAGRLLDWEVAHETGHLWFYSLVGNDQARQPFADEALTDFLARNLLNDFVPSQCPTGRLDHTLYDIGDCYAWVVYVQGVAYLRAYRDAVGADAFWRGLANYVAAYRNGIGGTRAALDALARASGVPADVSRFPTLYPPMLPSPILPGLLF